jgi:Rrf2 family protein
VNLSLAKVIMLGLQFSQRTDLALHGLWALAHLDGEDLTFLSEIVQPQNVSASYLSKVFQQLRRAGLVRAVRGKRGGYTLARPPQDITVGDVVRAMEGGLQPMYQCLAKERCCDAEADCLLLRLFAKAEQQMYAALDEATLADLLADFQRNRDRMSWLLSRYPSRPNL